ncbi:MAG: hypothetical protein MN733_17615 [Nitrososphaera sp.]|nr:hypothetical protein [Nitrososphaera sp.]
MNMMEQIEMNLELKFGAYCLDDADERKAVAEYILQQLTRFYYIGHKEGYRDGYVDGHRDWL